MSHQLRHGRGVFRPVFRGLGSFSVPPITLAVNHDEIDPRVLPEVLRNAVPKGFVGTAPYVVKTLDGEYLVAADGTAQFFPLGRSPLAPIDVNGRERMSGPRLGAWVQYGEVKCPNEANIGACWIPETTIETGAGVETIGMTSCYGDGGYPGQCGAVWNGVAANQPKGIPQCVKTPEGGWTHPNCLAPPPPPPEEPPPPPPPPPEEPPTDGDLDCPPGQRNLKMILGLRCVYGAVACPDGEGLYTVFETDADGNIIGGLGYRVDKASLDADQIPVDDTLTESNCAPPPEGSLACPTNGTFDLYDLEGNHIASNVAEADLPPGAEIVLADDERCGPPDTPPPTIPPPTIPPPTIPPPTIPPGVGPVGPLPPPPLPPPVSPPPGLPTGAPIPTAPMPGAPIQNKGFTGGFIPCGTQPPIKLRVLPTETLPSRPDSWTEQWTSL